jgi:DNA-binding transcriptional regulator YiaG
MTKSTLDVTIGGLHFQAKFQRAETKANAVEARRLRHFEKFVVEMLCQFAKPSPEGFQFLRTRSRIKAADFAELINVTPETVSRWENDKNEMPALAWELMVSIAEEKLQGKTDTLDRLRRRRLARETAPKLLKMPAAELSL